LLATRTATVSWQNDMTTHQVNLSVGAALRASYLPLLLKNRH